MATRYHLQNNSDFGGGAGRPWKRTSGLATERGCPPSGLARERGTELCETNWKVDRTEPCEPNRIKQAQLEDIDIECNCVGFLGVTYSASLWATVGVRDLQPSIVHLEWSDGGESVRVRTHWWFLEQVNVEVEMLESQMSESIFETWVFDSTASLLRRCIMVPPPLAQAPCNVLFPTVVRHKVIWE